jgi:hypothetical protein
MASFFEYNNGSRGAKKARCVLTSLPNEIPRQRANIYKEQPGKVQTKNTVNREIILVFYRQMTHH